MNTTTIGTVIFSFFSTHLPKEKGFGANTIASYSDCMKLLLNFCCTHQNMTIDAIPIDDFTDTLILDFLDYLERERDASPQTRNQRLSVVKSFFRFLARQEPTTVAMCERVCAIAFKKTDHKIVASLGKDEIAAIISATDPSTLNGARDRALLSLMHNTGARVQELCDLKIGDLSENQVLQVQITGKGRKQRTTPLWPETMHALKHYLELRGTVDDDGHRHLFLNARGIPISRFGIGYIVKKYANLASHTCPSLEGKKVTPHIFRHSTALHLIQSGANIVTVKEWLGHADIKTTMGYVEIDMEMKQKALARCPAPVPSTSTPQATWRKPGIMEFLDSLGKVTLC